MRHAGFVLPAEALEPDVYGLTLVTGWLHARFARLCSAGYRPETPVPDFNDGARGEGFSNCFRVDVWAC